MPANKDNGVMLATAFGALALSILIGLVQATAAPTSATVTVGGHTYFVLLATNQQQWQHGLMNYSFSCASPGMCVNGMLFIFPSAGSECFWMKDTPQPLTQTWIANGTVTNVYKATPESTTSVCAYGNEVLELYSRLPSNIAPGSAVSVKIS